MNVWCCWYLLSEDEKKHVWKGFWFAGVFHKDVWVASAGVLSGPWWGYLHTIGNCCGAWTETESSHAVVVSSDSGLPSLLFLLQQVGRSSLQLFTLHSGVGMESTFTSDSVHYLGPGGDFLVLSAVIIHLPSWLIADSLPCAREGPPEGLFWQTEFTKINFHQFAQVNLMITFDQKSQLEGVWMCVGAWGWVGGWVWVWQMDDYYLEKSNPSSRGLLEETHTRVQWMNALQLCSYLLASVSINVLQRLTFLPQALGRLQGPRPLFTLRCSRAATRSLSRY